MKNERINATQTQTLTSKIVWKLKQLWTKNIYSNTQLFLLKTRFECYMILVGYDFPIYPDICAHSTFAFTLQHLQSILRSSNKMKTCCRFLRRPTTHPPFTHPLKAILEKELVFFIIYQHKWSFALHFFHWGVSSKLA